ncbi:MAG: PAS domain-containing sensor histidine kinase [Chloroflexota bacterium]
MVTTRQPGETLTPGTAAPLPQAPVPLPAILPDGQSSAVLEALGVAVYTTDSCGRITYYNEAAAELWGRRPEIGVDEWCGSWKIYTTEGEHLPHDQCPMAITLRENRPVRGIEAIAERPDGTRINFMPLPTPLRDEHGNLIGAVNVLVDVTDRHRAEAEAIAQRDLMTTISQNMSTGLVMVDRDNQIEFMNRAAEEITGYTFEQLRGKDAHDTIHRQYPDGTPMPRDECTIAQSNASLERTESHEDVFVRPDGSRYDVICNIAPVLQSGARVGMIVDLRDATEEKRAQEAIKQSLELKDQFLGLVSHELRTPIATIIGNAILLQRRSEALSPESKTQALADIADESQKLQRIIENLLLITRLEASQSLETEPLRLPIAAEEAVMAFRRRNPLRTISIETDGDVPIAVGHPMMLPLVFDNLISNADKYSPLDAPIHIRMYGGPDGDVRACIRDYGIGIDGADTSHVFTPFYRSRRARTQASGIGLGLAVCKRVIEAQGGRIWAATRPEGGCDFIVSLKRASDD